MNNAPTLYLGWEFFQPVRCGMARSFSGLAANAKCKMQNVKCKIVVFASQMILNMPSYPTAMSS